MSIQEQSRGHRAAGRADHLSAILKAPVATDPETIRRYVPEKVRDTGWWARTTDEQRANLVRSVIYLKLKGYTDQQITELRTAVFRMFLRGEIPGRKRLPVAHCVSVTAADTTARTAPPARQQRKPRNRALREKIERLKREKEFEEFSREELVAFATHDELTGLPNRHAYEMAPTKPVKAFADLEGLKWINDNIGHEAGDQLLIALADILGEEGLDAYRLGKAADEFVVQFDGVQDADQAMWRVNERLKRQPIRAAGRVLSGFQLSYGIGPDVDTADEKMNRAKAELQQIGLRARRGERPAALQEIVEGVPISIAPPPEPSNQATLAKVVQITHRTMPYAPRITPDQLPVAQQRKSA
jgi:GGDEF domain-containing protein